MKMTCLHNGNGDLYRKILHIILGSSNSGRSLVDLGCGRADHSQACGFSEVVLVDDSDWAAEFRANDPRFVRADLLSESPVFDLRYDVAFASDVIEHFTPKEGGKLLDRMKSISTTQFIFTPLGPYFTDLENAGHHTHKSAWYPHSLPGFVSIECPVWHALLHVGAFFAWRIEGWNWPVECERVYRLLRSKNLVEPIAIYE